MWTLATTPEKTVLHDINLYAKPGQKIAFVGATGAGKTTITNLINRFYDIADGKIRYDGINIRKIKKAICAALLGIVLQDTTCSPAPSWTTSATASWMPPTRSALPPQSWPTPMAFIKRLPEGYDTMLTGDGANLSQGQRQLLAIARAAVADPPVLILDEATSSIDTRTEALVQRGMDGLMAGRTSLSLPTACPPCAMPTASWCWSTAASSSAAATSCSLQKGSITSSTPARAVKRAGLFVLLCKEGTEETSNKNLLRGIAPAGDF